MNKEMKVRLCCLASTILGLALATYAAYTDNTGLWVLSIFLMLPGGWAVSKYEN